MAEDLTLEQILQRVQAPAPAPEQQIQQPTQERGFASLLGSALGGGSADRMGTVDDETAGRRALLNFGIQMLDASGPSPTRKSFGQILARGLSGAGESQAASEAVTAAKMGAAQEQRQKAQEMRIAALKEAIPLLTLQQKQKALASMPGSLTGNTSIAAVGAGDTPPAVARGDTSVPAGWVANNPGNLMYAGQQGVTGTIPLTGGRVLAAFPDMASGVAANANQILLNQDTHGVNTVRGMVTRWVNGPNAKPGEGPDLTSYVADTAKRMGVDPDRPINFHDQKLLEGFILAQQPHETGGKGIALNPDDVTKGVTTALTRKGAPGGGTTTTAAATPPDAKTPPAASTARPGVQEGGDAPPPPGGAPGPATAYPQAGGGFGRAVAGADARLGPQQVTVAPPPAAAATPMRETFVKNPSTGKVERQLVPTTETKTSQADVPSVVAAIQEGQQRGAVAGLEGGTQVAGPPGTVPIKPVAEAPWAGVAHGAADYNTGAPATTTPPAQQPVTPQQPPAQQPAVPARAPLYTRPELTADERESFNPNLPADTKQAFEREYQSALREGDTAAARKVQDEYGKALAARAQQAQQAQAAYNLKQQELAQTARIEETKRDAADAKDAADRAHAIQLKGIEGEQTRLTNREQVKNKASQDLQDNLAKESLAARKRVDSLEAALQLSGNVKDATVLGNLSIGGVSTVDLLKGLNIGTDKLQNEVSNIQELRTALLGVAKSMKDGVALGAVSDKDMDFILGMGPSLMMDASTREAVIGNLIGQQRRQMKFGTEVSKLLSKGMDIGDAIEEADKRLTPVTPLVPDDVWNAPRGDKKAKDWFDANVPNNTIYRTTDGVRHIMHPPGWTPPKGYGG